MATRAQHFQLELKQKWGITSTINPDGTLTMHSSDLLEDEEVSDRIDPYSKENGSGVWDRAEGRVEEPYSVEYDPPPAQAA